MVEIKKEGFFSTNGERSMMRLLSFLCFLLLAVIDYILLCRSYYADKPFDYWFTIFFTVTNLIFLICTFFPKYLQKIIELGAANFQKVKGAVSSILPETGEKQNEKTN